LNLKDHFMPPCQPIARPASRLFLGALAAAALSAMASLTPMAARAGDEDAVVARVDGVEIRKSDVTLATEMLGPALSQLDAGDRQKNVVQFLIDMKLAAKTSAAKAYADDADFKRRLGFARDKLMMDKFLDEAANAAKTEAAMRKVYDEAAQQITKETEVRARHILVESEDEAKAIVAELNKGADFAELAKKKSKDPGASDGGDLGYFTKDQMVKEFSDAAFTLEKGKISGPVKSQFGWHVIKLEDKRARKPPEFDKVKEQIESFVARKAQAEAIAKLRETAKIERMDGDADKKADTPKTDEKK